MTPYVLLLSHCVRYDEGMEQRNPTHLLCKRSPFAHSADWPEAGHQVKISELAEYGSIGADGSVDRLIVTAAVHDAATLLQPVLAHEHVGPMAVALVRDGRISSESMGHLSSFLSKHPGAQYDLPAAQAAANATLTRWGEDHVIRLEERVEAAQNTVSRVSELGIEQRLEPLQLQSADIDI